MFKLNKSTSKRIIAGALALSCSFLPSCKNNSKKPVEAPTVYYEANTDKNDIAEALRESIRTLDTTSNAVINVNGGTLVASFATIDDYLYTQDIIEAYRPFFDAGYIEILVQDHYLDKIPSLPTDKYYSFILNGDFSETNLEDIFKEFNIKEIVLQNDARGKDVAYFLNKGIDVRISSIKFDLGKLENLKLDDDNMGYLIVRLNNSSKGKDLVFPNAHYINVIFNGIEPKSIKTNSKINLFKGNIKNTLFDCPDESSVYFDLEDLKTEYDIKQRFIYSVMNVSTIQLRSDDYRAQSVKVDNDVYFYDKDGNVVAIYKKNSNLLYTGYDIGDLISLELGNENIDVFYSYRSNKLEFSFYNSIDDYYNNLQFINKYRPIFNNICIDLYINNENYKEVASLPRNEKYCFNFDYNSNFNEDISSYFEGLDIRELRFNNGIKLTDNDIKFFLNLPCDISVSEWDDLINFTRLNNLINNSEAEFSLTICNDKPHGNLIIPAFSKTYLNFGGPATVSRVTSRSKETILSTYSTNTELIVPDSSKVVISVADTTFLDPYGDRFIFPESYSNSTVVSASNASSLVIRGYDFTITGTNEDGVMILRDEDGEVLGTATREGFEEAESYTRSLIK